MNKRRKLTLASDFDYYLPPELISQKPIKPRDQARLLILEKKSGRISHDHFFNLAKYLNAGDTLVFNNSKVIPARLNGKKSTGGKMEIFLLKQFPSFPRRGQGEVLKVAHIQGDSKPLSGLPLERGERRNIWQVLIGGKVKAGQEILLPKNIKAKIIQKESDNLWLVQFNCADKKLFAIGETPTPPYIKTKAKLADYQTIYAKTFGSVAAPTAGLHFTKPLIARLKKQGVKIEYLTLHVGLGTFAPVKTKYINEHKMHPEFAILDQKTATRLNRAKTAGRKIIACGTTTVRTLEALTDKNGKLKPQTGWLNIFIYPGYKFKFVDAMITNFHLPKSTLLMLVSAFAGQNLIKKSYREAIKKKYKFYSFGDGMMIK